MAKRPVLSAVLIAVLLPFSVRAELVGPPLDAADPATMVRLGARYEHAEGVERDYLRAASLYCSAGRQGHGEALHALGWMYANGRGLPADDRVAARLFAMAARQGHHHAATLLERFGKSDAPLPPCLADEQATRTVGKTAALAAAQAGPARDLRNLSGARIHKLVSKLSRQYRVDPNLALAIMYMESGFNVRARSPKNAHGLMQLIPETAERFNVRDIYKPEDNIRGGLLYLRWLLNYFRGDVALAAAAYNAGETAVDRHKGVPPFAETRAYVARLATLYRKAVHPYDESAARAAKQAMASWRARNGLRKSP